MGKEKNRFDNIRTDFDLDKDVTFDISKARRELNSPDPVSTILRGHLYIEHTLDEILKLALTHSEFLNLKNIAFHIKPRLCAALGIIDSSILNMCLKINKVRNSLAHHLDAELEHSLFEDMLSDFPKHLRPRFLESLDRSKSSTHLIAALIRDFVGILQVLRRHYEIHLEHKKLSLEVASEALRDLTCDAPSHSANDKSSS